MRVVLFTLLGVLLLAPSSWAAITFVKASTQGSCASTSGCATSFASLPSAGNAIIVTLSCWNGTAICSVSSVTDNQGNTYTQSACKDGIDGKSKVCIHRATNIGSPSGTFTVTANVAASTAVEVVAVEYSGMQNSSPEDATASGTATTGNADTGASASTSQNDELSVCVMNQSSADTNINVTTPTGYTRRGVQQDASTTIGFESSDKILTTTGAQQCQWTHDQTAMSGQVSQLVTFKAAGGASVSFGILRRRTQ